MVCSRQGGGRGQLRERLQPADHSRRRQERRLGLGLSHTLQASMQPRETRLLIDRGDAGRVADRVLLSRFAPDREECCRGRDNSTPAATLTARVGPASGFAYEEWNPHTRWTYANDVEADVDP